MMYILSGMFLYRSRVVLLHVYSLVVCFVFFLLNDDASIVYY